MKEINHQFGNLRVMAFKCEMAAGYEMDFGIGQVALEGFGTFRDERRVVLSPDSQQWGMVGTEVFLKLMVEGNIGAIVENEVVLHLGAAWLADIVVIE